MISHVRRIVRGQFGGLKVSEEELADLLRTEVIKRDALEGEKATAAQKLLKRAARKRERGEAAPAPEVPVTPDVPPPPLPSPAGRWMKGNGMILNEGRGHIALAVQQHGAPGRALCRAEGIPPDSARVSLAGFEG